MNRVTKDFFVGEHAQFIKMQFVKPKNCGDPRCMKHNPTPEYVDAASSIPPCTKETADED